jgi:hypothetical protein
MSASTISPSRRRNVRWPMATTAWQVGCCSFCRQAISRQRRCFSRSANCIIYYNACILSELLERAERRQDYQRADAIKRANPASWKHVNLYGAYSFLDIGDGVDLQELVNLLEAARGRGAAAPD